MGSVCVAPLLPPQQTPSPQGGRPGSACPAAGQLFGERARPVLKVAFVACAPGRGSPGDGGDTKGRSDGMRPVQGPPPPLIPSSLAEMLVVVPAERWHWGLLVATGHGWLWGCAGQVALKAHLSDDVFIY